MIDFAARHRVVLTALALWLLFSLVFQASAGLRASWGARITGDEPFYLMATHSLLSDGDLDLRDEYRDRSYREFYDHPSPLWHQSEKTADGRELSPHQVGLSVLVLPAYAVAGLDGVKAFLGVIGGLTVAFTFVLALRITGRFREALAGAAVFGVSAPIFVFSTQIYPEMPAALLLVAAMTLHAGKDRPGAAAVLASGAAALGLMWLGVKYAPAAAVLAAFAFLRASGPSRAALVALLGIGGAHYIWFHLDTYGALTPYSVNMYYAGDGTASVVDEHFAFGNRLYRLLGLWTDRQFGLLRWAPAFAMGLAGAYFALRRRPAAALPLLLTFAGQLAVAAFFTITMRGWWFPGRQLVVVLPLVGVFIAAALVEWQRAAYLLASALTAYGAAITVALWRATSALEVTLAVNPFEMEWKPFAGVAGLFPLYTSYGPLTLLLTALWAAALGALLWLAWRTVPPSAAGMTSWLLDRTRLRHALARPGPSVRSSTEGSGIGG